MTLWQGIRRAELRTEIHGWAAKDQLLRLRFPTVLAGATPVSAVGDAVVARGYALLDNDSATAPWTLDNPAAEWFGLSTTLVVEASEARPRLSPPRSGGSRDRYGAGKGRRALGSSTRGCAHPKRSNCHLFGGTGEPLRGAPRRLQLAGLPYRRRRPDGKLVCSRGLGRCRARLQG